MKKIGFVLVLTMLCLSPLLAAEKNTVMVAGFRNLGGGDNISIVLSKSLISTLSMLSDVQVVTYETAAKITAKYEFWATNAANSDTLEMMGLELSVKKIIYGDYRVDETANTITVDYSIYDLRSGDILLTRTLSGPAGMDVFDTIDKMAQKVTVSVAGRPIDFAALTAPEVVTNTQVVTRTAVVTNNAYAPAYRPARRATLANTFFVPLGIILAAGGGYAINSLSQSAYQDYYTSLDTYTNAASNLDIYYELCMQKYQTLQIEQGLQIGLYAASGALTGLELYLLVRKPRLVQSFRWIALPGYFGLTYEF